MSAEFYHREIGDHQSLYFKTEDGYDEIVNQENTVLYQSGKPMYDMIAKLDNRDGDWWKFWRYDQEHFDTIVGAVALVGTVIFSPEPQLHVEEMFNNDHVITDEDFDQLLESNNG